MPGDIDHDTVYSCNYYEIIASSDEYCTASCSGGICTPNAPLDFDDVHKSRSQRKANKADPRAVTDLSKRFVGDIYLPEGLYPTP